jgi:hypothetical protein
MERLIEMNKKINKINYCSICNKKFEYEYKIQKFIITEANNHELDIHNIIDYKLYEEIMKYKEHDITIDYLMFNTNDLNIIDGLYEEGSKKIYIEQKKNIFTSEENRFSEHYGFLCFVNGTLDKVIVKSKTRVDKDDPVIYLPKNSVDRLKADYFFHTHPKTPHLGSRIKMSILYEFPSINDLLNFIEYHNRGMLIGSLVIAPEGIYNIRKYIFNRDKIRLDHEIFLSELEDVYIECYQESMTYYKNLKKTTKKIDNEYKISKKIFYNKIATNLSFIKKINKTLEKYDITIDFYNRVNINNKWIFPTIYIPNI